jgi:hypothetical protein
VLYLIFGKIKENYKRFLLLMVLPGKETYCEDLIFNTDVIMKAQYSDKT